MFMIDILYNEDMRLQKQTKQDPWIVAVSGGSDSMALLHMCMQADIKVIVAHMNYQKRESAKRDMKGVMAYCEVHHILCEVRYQNEPCTENFQAFARRQRYTFFHELIQRYHAKGVLVAHQLDDHLETYLMQQKRGAIPAYYGIKERSELFGCLVVRPLLSYTKQELMAYCAHHHVPYWLDESNLSDQYTRNWIRHTYIDGMSDAQKHQMMFTIQAENQRLAQLRQEAVMFFSTWRKDCASLLALPQALIDTVLHHWLKQECNIHVSAKELASIRSLLIQSGNGQRTTQAYQFHKEYGILSLIPHPQDIQADSYAYTYADITMLHPLTTPYYSLSDQGDVIEGITLYPDDFPITIRSPKPGDAIALRYGTKKLNRFFIDRKIPKQERQIWPIMVNQAGEIIFIAKLGCDISHFSNNPSVFVLK